MRVTHLFHSGFAVELESCNLLFDWWKGELPELDAATPLLVFVSHEHGDHYASHIWDLPKRIETVSYVIERDVEDDIPSTIAPESVLVVDANQSYDFAGLHIETLESNDEGVSFYLECEGKKMYYGADLNVWWWDRPQLENEASLAFCSGQLESLPKGEVDVAFLALDPRLQDGLIGVLTFEQIVGARHIFPMHYWENIAASKRLLQDERATDELLAKIHFEGLVEIN